MRIVLAKAARVPLNGPLRDKGYTAEVDEDTYKFLVSHGVLAEDKPKPEAEPEPEEDLDSEVATVTGSSEDWKRPAKTASAKAWKDYASHLGIKVSGLSKQEIIGAVEKHRS